MILPTLLRKAQEKQQPAEPEAVGSRSPGTTNDQMLSRREKRQILAKGTSLQLGITRGSMTAGDYPVKALDHLKEVCGSYPKGLGRDVPPRLCTENPALRPWDVVEQIQVTSSAVILMVSLAIP